MRKINDDLNIEYAKIFHLNLILDDAYVSKYEEYVSKYEKYLELFYDVLKKFKNIINKNSNDEIKFFYFDKFIEYLHNYSFVNNIICANPNKNIQKCKDNTINYANKYTELITNKKLLFNVPINEYLYLTDYLTNMCRIYPEKILEIINNSKDIHDKNFVDWINNEYKFKITMKPKQNIDMYKTNSQTSYDSNQDTLLQKEIEQNEKNKTTNEIIDKMKFYSFATNKTFNAFSDNKTYNAVDLRQELIEKYISKSTLEERNSVERNFKKDIEETKQNIEETKQNDVFIDKLLSIMNNIDNEFEQIAIGSEKIIYKIKQWDEYVLKINLHDNFIINGTYKLSFINDVIIKSFINKLKKIYNHKPHYYEHIIIPEYIGYIKINNNFFMYTIEKKLKTIIISDPTIKPIVYNTSEFTNDKTKTLKLSTKQQLEQYSKKQTQEHSITIRDEIQQQLKLKSQQMLQQPMQKNHLDHKNIEQFYPEQRLPLRVNKINIMKNFDRIIHDKKKETCTIKGNNFNCKVNFLIGVLQCILWFKKNNLIILDFKLQNFGYETINQKYNVYYLEQDFHDFDNLSNIKDINDENNYEIFKMYKYMNNYQPKTYIPFYNNFNDIDSVEKLIRYYEYFYASGFVYMLIEL